MKMKRAGAGALSLAAFAALVPRHFRKNPHQAWEDAVPAKGGLTLSLWDGSPRYWQV